MISLLKPFSLKSKLLLPFLVLLFASCGPERTEDEENNTNQSGENGLPGEEENQNEEEDPYGPWPEKRPGCNGHPDLCDRPFHEVVFPGTHNSMGNAEDEWVAPNHNLPMRAQLIDGIRVFLIDTYEQEEEILLCHFDCRLGSRPLLEAMEEFRSFLVHNPGEIITIIFEDSITASQTAAVLEEAGLRDFIYTHDRPEWPTLQEMIDADHRLVVTNERAGPPPAWMHHIWDLGWDSPFSFSSVEEFNCNHNRGTQSGDLFLLNHWVLNPLPNPRTARTTNSYEVLMSRVEECQDRWERLPTFIAIDFHEIGDLFEVVDILNGLRPPR